MSNTEFAYRSPVAKLLRFFRRSRDRWKEKCLTAKRQNKSLKTRLAKMKESRDRWKAEVRELRDGMRAETVEQPAKKRRGRSSPSRPGRPTKRVI